MSNRLASKQVGIEYLNYFVQHEIEKLAVFVLLQLSPALRNRFTEIWCPPSNVRADLVKIIEHNIKPGITLKSTYEGTK